jgi:hypothetical protein
MNNFKCLPLIVSFVLLVEQTYEFLMKLGLISC